MTVWHDVQLDPAMASQAVDALLAVAVRLDALTDARAQLAAVAQQDWVGAQRTRFDTDLDRLLAASTQVAVRLRDGAATIERDLEAAVAEQRRRQDAREAARAEARLEAARHAESDSRQARGGRPSGEGDRR